MSKLAQINWSWPEIENNDNNKTAIIVFSKLSIMKTTMTHFHYFKTRRSRIGSFKTRHIDRLICKGWVWIWYGFGTNFASVTANEFWTRFLHFILFWKKMFFSGNSLWGSLIAYLKNPKMEIPSWNSINVFKLGWGFSGVNVCINWSELDWTGLNWYCNIKRSETKSNSFVPQPI